MSDAGAPHEARAHAVSELVKQLAPNGRPAPREAVAIALAAGHIPLELAALYQRTNGLSLESVDIFDLDDALAWSGTETMAHEFPGAAVIGWDRAGYVFMIDAAATLHRGAGAVFALDKVYLAPHSAIFCTPDLATFLADVSAGKTPWRGPRLIEEESWRLRELLRLRSDRVDAHPPLPTQEMFTIAAAREVELTFGLAAFYGIANGLRFVRSGLEIFGAGEISPVDGARCANGMPGAIWFGRLPAGPRFAVTAANWRRPSDLVLQMSEGADPFAAPSYGRLLPTVISWIESDAENAP